LRRVDADLGVGAEPVAARGKVREAVAAVGASADRRRLLPGAGTGLEAVQLDPGIGKRLAGSTDDTTGNAALFLAQRRRSGSEQTNDAN
jgi:hypothetical protein